MQSNNPMILDVASLYNERISPGQERLTERDKALENYSLLTFFMFRKDVVDLILDFARGREKLKLVGLWSDVSGSRPLTQTLSMPAEQIKSRV